MIKAKQLIVPILMWIMLSAHLAQAGSGTLKGTFRYIDPVTKADQVLSYGYVYLRSATSPPPMEKFFSKADYILALNGGTPFQLSIPEGTYYLRLLQRKTAGVGPSSPFGPPVEGDFTWVQRTPITITAGGTVDLGNAYATAFMISPVTIIGTLKTQTGAPVPGYYVRAQTVPCTTDGQNNDVNQCGPEKALATQKTDANGKFTIYLKDPGTYYLNASPCLTTQWDLYSGNRCGAHPGPGPITLVNGDVKTVNIMMYLY